MPPLTLPRKTPGTLRAFGIVMASGVGGAAGVGAAVIRRDSRWLALTVPVAAAAAAPTMRDPSLVDRPYSAWSRLGGWAATASDHYVSQVAYESLRLTRHLGAERISQTEVGSGSGWLPKTTQTADAYPSQDSDVGSQDHRSSFDDFSRQPAHWWAESIRPLVYLLTLIESGRDADASPPSDIYTLY